MKKIVSIFLIAIFVSSSFSFAQSTASCQCTNWVVSSCPNVNGNQFVAWSNCTCRFGSDSMSCTETSTTPTNNCDWYSCPWGWNRTMTNNECFCNDWTHATPPPVAAWSTQSNSPTSVMGIECSSAQLLNGQCKLNIYDTLGIRQSVRNPGDATSVGVFVQDIVLSATFFIGTLVTIALVVSGIMFIFAASSGKDPANAKKWIVGSLVGLLIVVSSYVIIRLVQYIAKGF